MQNFEPTAMGSPAFCSPNNRSRTQNNPAYLPAFLMGDSTTSLQTSRAKQMNNSGQSLGTFPSFGRSKSPKGTITKEKKDKPSAPPVMSLEEGFHNFQTSHLNAAEVDSPAFQINNDFFGNFASETPGNMSMPLKFTPNHMTNTADEEESEHWVTVFGFYADSLHFILQEFSQLGLILKHFMPSDGNFVHILYDTKIQARRALARNGKIYNGTMMIGVIPCSDKKMMDACKDTRNASLVSCNKTKLSNGRDTNSLPRSLDRNGGKSVPQKDNSFLTKALDYVWGW